MDGREDIAHVIRIEIRDRGWLSVRTRATQTTLTLQLFCRIHWQHVGIGISRLGGTLQDTQVVSIRLC